jgi:hypothetical protein
MPRRRPWHTRGTLTVHSSGQSRPEVADAYHFRAGVLRGPRTRQYPPVKAVRCCDPHGCGAQSETRRTHGARIHLRADSLSTLFAVSSLKAKAPGLALITLNFRLNEPR